jgi:RimJ/RimL family protein N-acetyltransferase
MENEKYQINDFLSLTDIRLSDLEDLCAQINDKTVYENTLSIPFPYAESDGISFISGTLKTEEETNKRRNYAIRYNDKLIGIIGLLYNYGLHSFKSEIGYWISATYRNQGLMSNALQTFIRICFEEKRLYRLEANVFLANKASQKLLEKNGFKYEGTLRNAFVKDGQYKSSLIYSALRDEWLRR